MFSTRGLFSGTPCPLQESCHRPICPFSHSNISEDSQLSIPISQSASTSAAVSVPLPSTVPAKRSGPVLSKPNLPARNSTNEPPRKLQKLTATKRAQPPTTNVTHGVPTLKASAVKSIVPIPVRQTMLKTLFDHFSVLYYTILPLNPNIAADHALKQEEELYKASTKQTYRNSVIQCAASLKRRPSPDKVSHPSVGTEHDLHSRVKAHNTLKSLNLTKEILEPLIHSVEELEKWGYILEIPEGPGGDRPFHDGVVPCERCKVQFMVRDIAKDPFECTYHWGRAQTTRASGERVRMYQCCSQPTSDGGGCIQGRHVFYESDAKVLHSRHPFSCLESSPSGPNVTQLQVVVLDCEMIYTTGGMRVARVSCVDGSGATVLDEIIKMDEGVEVIDFNTRFSGITQENHQDAVLTLSAVRDALNRIMNQDTILVGHALNNDLNTLRIVHHRCIDTALIFQNNGYRRALRDLVRQHLGRLIQTGDAKAGHSSIEDSVATLDLLRWHILRKAGNLPKSNI